MNSANRFETLETTISRDNIVSQVAALLYATGFVKDNQEITNIQFGELFGSSDTELVPLTVSIKNEKEVHGKIYHG